MKIKYYSAGAGIRCGAVRCVLCRPYCGLNPSSNISREGHNNISVATLCAWPFSTVLAACRFVVVLSTRWQGPNPLPATKKESVAAFISRWAHDFGQKMPNKDATHLYIGTKKVKYYHYRGALCESVESTSVSATACSPYFYSHSITLRISLSCTVVCFSNLCMNSRMIFILLHNSPVPVLHTYPVLSFMIDTWFYVVFCAYCCVYTLP